jgi:hypothetical protein
MACGTPPLDANAPAWPWTEQQYLTVPYVESSQMMDQYWTPQQHGMQSRIVAAKAKKAIEQAAQEHPGWSAVAAQLDDRDPRKKVANPIKVRPTGPSGLEKQRALVAACVKARSRPLTHTAPPQNLADLHRRIIEQAADPELQELKRWSQDELTPRFPPSNLFEETAGTQNSDLPRILGRSAQALNLSPKAEDAPGLDLKFLDDDDDTPPESQGDFLRSVANPSEIIAIEDKRPAAFAPPNMPPQPRFLRPRETAV